MFPSVIFFVFVLSLGAGPLESYARNVKNYEKSYSEIHERYARQIAPGTKWCGNGDKASHYEDLGYFSKTDACCREHDNCPSFIAGRKTKHGLTNPDKSTRSHCDCDKKFYECLTKASTAMSLVIGKIYFSFLGKKCFHEKKCPAGETCEAEYEWGDGRSYLPNKAQIVKMYREALLESETEIDSFEDDIMRY